MVKLKSRGGISLSIGAVVLRRKGFDPDIAPDGIVPSMRASDN